MASFSPLWGGKFQSTPPRKGVAPGSPPSAEEHNSFNPHPRVRGWHDPSPVIQDTQIVSIHTPA